MSVIQIKLFVTLGQPERVMISIIDIVSSHFSDVEEIYFPNNLDGVLPEAWQYYSCEERGVGIYSTVFATMHTSDTEYCDTGSSSGYQY